MTLKIQYSITSKSPPGGSWGQHVSKKKDLSDGQTTSEIPLSLTIPTSDLGELCQKLIVDLAFTPTSGV